MNKKLLSCLALTPFLFAGCGDIEIPESIPTATPNAVPTLDTTNILVSPTPEASIAALSCTALQSERDNLAEAVTLTQEELKTCQTEKVQLESLSATSTVANNQIKEITPLLKKYLKQVKQEEYKFDKCGALGIVTGKEWYDDFQSALSASNILFSKLERQMEATDFYSVCYSDEGKTALFLGARADRENEFHLIKYHFASKSLKESILLGGTCKNCPTSFGKRFGPYITLNSTSGKYNYYYDSNIIEKQ